MEAMNARADNGTIGKYELIEEIGAGSMGRVWRARDPVTERDVAVKISEQPESDTERGERRRRKLFYNEVKAAGMLHHPNIISTIDAGVDEGRRYIVMEFVDGARTLADIALPGKLLPVANVLKIMYDCAAAFDYAHSKGVVHRDIKPTNIMLDTKGQVKIGDFGVALIDRADVEETQVVGRLGSPRYMAPEQLLAGEVTNQSDIYSLGIVIYELLTGVSPFAGKHVGEIARKVLKEAHQPIRELNADVPEQLSAVVDRTLKKHPAGRYRTAMDLAGDLQIILEDLEFTDSKRTGPTAIKILQELDSFSGFDPSELAELLAVSVWEEYAPGAVIALEGEGDSTAGVIAVGEAVIESGKTRVSKLGAGASFGDFGLVETGERGARIVATRICTVLRISSNQADRLSPGCSRRLYRLLASGYAGRLQQLQRRILRRTGK
ncbi:MAG: serine/threonine protein kinase [Gammaproteobacteria bacterium]|jgi:serine/threonine protein kinase